MCSTHDGRAECYACSDTQPWYAGVRRQDALLCDCKQRQVRAQLLQAINLCVDCARIVVKGPRCKSCGQRRRRELGPRHDSQAGVPLRERYARKYAGRP